MSTSPQPVQHNIAEVRKELQAILWSAEFAGSDRLSRFLTYVVEQYLQGNAERLKEAVIGVEVFDRTPGYDPKIEPIVRTEARRLRAKLDSYYESAGRDHAVRITVPKGGYVPQIEMTRSRVVQMPPPETTPQTLPEPAKPVRKRWPVYGALAAAAIACAVAAGWLAQRAPTPLPPPKQLNITSLPGREMSPGFSPDGSQIVFSWESEDPNRSGLYVTMTRGAPMRRLTTNVLDRYPSWSPDGNWIAFVRADREIMLIHPLGGQERTLSPGSSVSQIAWAPDSRSLVAVQHRGDGHYRLFLVSVPGGERRQITNPPPEYIGDYDAAFSPDGRQLAFARCGLWSCDINVMPAAGGEPRIIARRQIRLVGLTWTHDGREIVFASGRRGFMRLYRLNVNSPSAPALVTSATDDAFLPAIWRDRLAYVHEELNINLWKLDLASGARTKIIASTKVESSPQISPDGSRIAFVSDRTGFDEIWEAGRDGADPVQITNFADGSAGSPRWSPDGRHIVFDHLAALGRRIYVVETAGGAPRPVSDPGNVARPSWSHDGNWIYYAWNAGADWQVWKVDWRRPDRRERVTQNGGFEAYESVDRAFLYYSRDAELWRKALPSGSEERLLAAIENGWWSLAPAGVYFVRFGQDLFANDSKNVYFYDFRTREISRVTSITGIVYAYRPDFCVSPDGKTILYGLQQVSNTEIRMVDNFR